MSITAEEIAKWKELAEKATPGPWNYYGDGDITQTAHITRDVWTIPMSKDDMWFVAAARTAVPALIQEVERLRASRPEWVKCRQEQIEAVAEANKLRAENKLLRAEMARLVLATEVKSEP